MVLIAKSRADTVSETQNARESLALLYLSVHSCGADHGRTQPYLDWLAAETTKNNRGNYDPKALPLI